MRSSHLARIGFPAIVAVIGVLIFEASRADDKPAAAADETAALFERLDKNKDGVVTKDEVPAEHQSLLERLLGKADKNKDGKLDKTEFVAGLKGSRPDRPLEKLEAEDRPKSPPVPDAQALDGFLKRLDANGDGKIVLEEIPAEAREKAAGLLGKLGLDLQKGATLDEVRKAAEKLRGLAPAAKTVPADAGNLFARLDKNGDGKITEDEVPEGIKPRFARLLERGDKNGDKGLSAEEFRAVAPQALQRGKPNQRPQVAAGPGGLFKALDANGDGKLSAGEIEAAASALRKLDKNGDGEISREELGGPAANDRAAIPVEQRLRFLMRRDKDNDGKLSREELPEGLQAIFDRIDANNDGSLDQTELRTILERREKRGGVRKKPSD